MKKALLTLVAVLCAICCADAQQRTKTTSVLEIYDITTGTRTVLKEFPNLLIEAPNWTMDGKWLIFNSRGRLYRISPTNPASPNSSIPSSRATATTTTFSRSMASLSPSATAPRRIVVRASTLCPSRVAHRALSLLLRRATCTAGAPMVRCWHTAHSATTARSRISTSFPPRVARRFVLQRPRVWTMVPSIHPMVSTSGSTLYVLA